MSDKKRIKKKDEKDIVEAFTNNSSGEDKKKNYDTNKFDKEGFFAQLIQGCYFADIIRNIDKAKEYVVQIPLEYKDAFDKGKLFLNENKNNGQLWPALMKKAENGRNQFVGNLPIKQQDIVIGDPLQDLAVGYHNLYMQQQMMKLAEQMTLALEAVERIEKGQLDDRIGLLKAGKNQFILAMDLPDDERKIAIANARTSISEAQSQLFETLKRRINTFKPIPEQEWRQLLEEVKKKGYLRKKYDAYNEIMEYYDLYLQATHMLAATYAICGEKEIAEKTFDMSIKDVKELDFDNVKSLEYLHGDDPGMLYNDAIGSLIVEREKLISDVEYLKFEISGDKLLEVIDNEEDE